MSSSTNGIDILLNWDVFTTPGITIRTNTPAPNTKETFWHLLSSTLIYGKRDAVLVDTFLTVKQSDDLVKWVAASGKNLTSDIYHSWTRRPLLRYRSGSSSLCECQGRRHPW